MSNFNPNDSLGALPPADIANYLLSIDDIDGANNFLTPGVVGQGFSPFHPSYGYTGLAIGFIPAGSTAQNGKISIEGANNIDPDASLINERIKITLDKFYIDSYPGAGQHEILCEFAGKNQIATETEELRFALRAFANDGESASVNGHPIFKGLTVGANGISFEGRTINIRSRSDSTLLSALDSSTFKSGLSLITMAQPALKPFADLAGSVVKVALSRSANRQVHSFNVGLDFSQNNTSARLRLGSYVIVQISEANWNWGSVYWDINSQAMKSTLGVAPRANYIVLGVSPFV
ncbi:hypothetical protein [Burkholderia cepacia]|uniref:hypothetical protein n=1 Tax=Burkholderia cepacia TaxID=292 RepID=UPI000AEA0A9B|nr:hypothetical protein [Burkholderia cepacia]